MNKKNLNLPVVLIHEMDNTQYKIGATLLAINEAANTCTVKFKNGRVERGIPMDKVFINEGFIDTVKKYGKKVASWIAEKVQGFIMLLNPDGEEDVNSAAHPVNMVAMQSQGMIPAFAQFYPNNNMLELADGLGIKADVPAADYDNCGQAAQEIDDINRFWTRVMREAGTSDKSIEESVKFVNENFYHDVFSQKKAVNEAGILSLRPVVDGLDRKNLNGMIVGTETLKGFIEASIDGQLKTTIADTIGDLDDDDDEMVDMEDALDDDNDYMDDPRYAAAKEATRREYEKKIKRGDNKTKPLLIWGAPGIGKTEILRQCIHDYRNHPNSPRMLAMYDLNCANLDGDSFRLPKNIDTRGDETAAKDTTFEQATLSWLPMYTPSDAEYNEKMEKRFELCQHLTSDGSAMVDAESGEVMQGGILFLDEVVRARKTGFEALMNICDRKLQEKVLARSWGIICASNRFTDDPNQESDTALESTPILQRFTVVTYVPTKKEWLDWARSYGASGKANVEPEICNFIEAMPDYIWYRTVDFGGYDEELAEIKDDLSLDGEIYEPDGGGVYWEAWKALKDLNDEGKNPLANTMQTWNGRTWHEISEEYREMLRQLLSPKVMPKKKYTYDQISLRSYIKRNYNGASPEFIQEALAYVPEDHWKWWCHKYLLAYNVEDYKDAVSRKLTPSEMMEKVRHGLIGIVKKKTASGDTGRDETAPVRMLKDYYSWRKTFENQALLDSIYNTGYLPADMKAADDASPRDSEGLKWKNDSAIVGEVNKFILSEYPGGKMSAGDDYMQYAKLISPVLPVLQDKLSFIGVKKIDANMQKKIEDIIENALGVDLKAPSKKDIENIFKLKTGSIYGDVPLIAYDKMNPVILKVVYYLYNNCDFVKYMVNYTKYRIKIDFTRDTFNMIGGFMNGNDYQDELCKNLDMKGAELQNAMKTIERGINTICGTGQNKNGTASNAINLQSNGTITDIIHFNVFKLLQIMLMEANTFQQNFRQVGQVDKK